MIFLPCVKPGVGRDGTAAEGIGFDAFGSLVKIEKNDFGPGRGRLEEGFLLIGAVGLAAEQGGILPRDFAAGVEPGALALGNGDILLDDARLHLGDEFFPQRFQGG